jgi:hypothetical protein
MRRKIFISSSPGDYDLAQDLAVRLNKSGLKIVKVVTPSDSTDAGEYLEVVLRKALRGVNEVIIILTRNSLNNQWLSFQMGVATSLGKHITPLIQGIEPEELSELIRQMDYVRYADLDEYISRLQRSLEEPSQSAA